MSAQHRPSSERRNVVATGPARVDRSLLLTAMIYLGIVLGAMIAAEAVSDGDSTSLVTQIVAVAGPIGGFILLAAGGKQGLETASRIEEKTDQQMEDLSTIKHAVNGEMGKQFGDLHERVRKLEQCAAGTRQDVAEIKDVLQRIVPPT